MSKKLSVKVWPSKNGYQAEFPEEKLDFIKERPSFGICFSGGGVRSAACSLGQMRVLSQEGILPKLRYISAISGGSWFAVPFTYLPGDKSDRTFLGEHVDPADLKLDEHFPDTEDQAKRGRLLKAGLFHFSLIKAEFLKHQNLLKTWAGGGIKRQPDELFGEFLHQVFLQPLGLPDDQRYACHTTRSRDAILARNPGLKAEDFVCVEQKQRPYLITIGSVVNWNVFTKIQSIHTLTSKTKEVAQTPFYQMEHTPLYSGTPRRYEGDDTLGLTKIGGGYLENIGVDASDPRGRMDDDTVEVREPVSGLRRFSPQDMMAISGAAPGIFALYGKILTALFGVLLRTTPMRLSSKVALKTLNSFLKQICKIFPEMRLWHLEEGKRCEDRVLPCHDGGYVDNLGIIPLFRRQVRTIICCVNTDVSLFPRLDKKGEVIQPVDNSLRVLFNEDDAVESIPHRWTKRRNHFLDNSPGNGFDTYTSTIENLRASVKSGGPAVYKGRYRVLRNEWHETSAYEADIIWVYNTFCAGWRDQLPQEIRDRFGLDHLRQALNEEEPSGSPDETFKNFPNIATFLENKSWDQELGETSFEALLDGIEPVLLTHYQIGLLANNAGWNMKQAIEQGMLNRL
jgi:hypothetical protein